MPDEKTNMNVERTAGVTRGIVILNIILNFDVFITIAASSRLESILRSIPPMRIYANGA